MTKCIWYIGNWQNNYDDYISRSAITKAILNKRDDVHFTFVGSHDAVWSPSLIDSLNREADMLLIGGEITDRLEAFDIGIDDIDKIDVPIVGYGVGYNRLPFATHDVKSPVWKQLSKIIERAKLFSVSSQGAYDEISQVTGINDIDIVPAPSMFIDAAKYSHPSLESYKFKVGLNLATDHIEQRFESLEAATRKMTFFMSALKELIGEYNIKLYLIEHTQSGHIIKDDLRAEFTHLFGEEGCIVSRECTDLFPPKEYLAPFIADIYSKMDLVLGMRDSSNAVAFGQNIPCVGLGDNKNLKWLAEHMGLEEEIISLDAEGSRAFNKINKIIGNIVSDIEAYKDKIGHRYTELKYVNEAFADKLVSIL